MILSDLHLVYLLLGGVALGTLANGLLFLLTFQLRNDIYDAASDATEKRHAFNGEATELRFKMAVADDVAGEVIRTAIQYGRLQNVIERFCAALDSCKEGDPEIVPLGCEEPGPEDVPTDLPPAAIPADDEDALQF